MLVYRCLSNLEIRDLYKGFHEHGAFTKGKNTFHYKDGVSYIHFFRYSQFAEYYYKLKSNLPYDRFIAIMVADIPDDILRKNEGYGYYHFLDYSIYDERVLPVIEYAIPSDEFNSDYIKCINNHIYPEYKSSYDEYIFYLTMLNDLFPKFQYDFDRLTDYLLKVGIDSLIDDKVKVKKREKSEFFY